AGAAPDRFCPLLGRLFAKIDPRRPRKEAGDPLDLLPGIRQRRQIEPPLGRRARAVGGSGAPPCLLRLSHRPCPPPPPPPPLPRLDAGGGGPPRAPSPTPPAAAPARRPRLSSAKSVADKVRCIGFQAPRYRSSRATLGPGARSSAAQGRTCSGPSGRIISR